MSPVHLVSAGLLALALCANAAATEVLPMDTAAQDCPPAPAEPQTAATVVNDSAAEVVTNGLETEPGLPAAATQPARSTGGGGDDSSAPARTSRWNAFLPGMVR